MNDFQIHHRENGDFDVEHLAPQRREERRQERTRHVWVSWVLRTGKGLQRPFQRVQVTCAAWTTRQTFKHRAIASTAAGLGSITRGRAHE